MVFILGSDGYIGNALTQRLLKEGYTVFGFDNFWRRRWIKESMKSISATSLLNKGEKTKQFSNLPFYFEQIDICKEDIYLDRRIADYKPSVIINLAHNPSGPYSMKSKEHAKEVLVNNIVGTNSILWSIKNHCPDCHYITIGTAGEYDHYGNIDIEEGYFQFKHKGRQSNMMIFPRRPGSIYHTSKCASTYLIDYLTRAWNLKCTDVMQGIVFGIYTSEIDRSKIYSRFDFDEAGGTVLNRFIIQAIVSLPLTIYGSGKHKRSFLSLNDSIQALMIAVNNPPKAGKVQTWNQLSEWHSINDIADMVIKCGFDMKILTTTAQWIDNPRVEYTSDHYYNFVTDKLNGFGYKPTRTIEEEIKYCLTLLYPLKYKLEKYKNIIMPKIKFT